MFFLVIQVHDICLYVKKKCINSLVPLSRDGGGGKALAECPARNASIYYVLPYIKKLIYNIFSKIGRPHRERSTSLFMDGPYIT